MIVQTYKSLKQIQSITTRRQHSLMQDMSVPLRHIGVSLNLRCNNTRIPSADWHYISPITKLCTSHLATKKMLWKLHPGETCTSLTAFFKYKTTNPTQYCYSEFPKHFTFHKDTGKWTPRKAPGESTIGRVFSVSQRTMSTSACVCFCFMCPALHAMTI